MDEFLDIQIRPAREVAARMLVLHALARRSIIESLAAEQEIDEEDDPDDLFFDLGGFVEASGVQTWLEPDEASVLRRPPGGISAQEVERIGSSGPSLGALIDAVVPQTHGPLDLDDQTVSSLVTKLDLPSDEVAASLRETAELLLWRGEIEVELCAASGHEKTALMRIIRETAEEAAIAGLVVLSADGDFASDAGAFGQLSDLDLAVFLIQAEARLKALNWLCGFGETWSDVPLEL